MPVCAECKKDVTIGYQTIKTKRNTELCFCDECLKKYRRKEADNARDSH